MRGLVVVVLVGVALWVAAAGLAIWWAIRLLRRLSDSTRRLVDRGSLSVKAHLAPGSTGRVAAARLRLRGAIERTRRMLDDAARRNCPLGDLPGIFRRIERLADAVDGELALLDRDGDRIQRARLGAVLVRSDELASMAAGIRRTVSGVHAEMQIDGFEMLQRDLDVELSALRAGAAAARQPTLAPTRPAPSP